MSSPVPADDLEELLAEALARFDDGGEIALAAYVAAHPQQSTRLERAIRRCRDMGLLGTPAPEATHPERLGDFRLLRRIGGGGMGVVYEAVQEQLGRLVALKIIRPELLFFEGARERFRREIDAVARLEHPAIVPVLASGEHEGVPFYAMELVPGITVEQVCTALRGRVPAELRGADLGLCLPVPADASGELFVDGWWQAVTRVGQQVAQGLRHAHLRGIVHRDVKPSNVMLTPHGQAVLLDFGVAQVRTTPDLTRSGATPGSPAFMSPEQRRGQATDERTDVFSLAATLWQMLTLQRPFALGADGKLAELLPPLRHHNRGAPPELELVLRTAMDPDRERRHGDMAAFAADLQAVRERRPITVRPLGPGLRLWRWCQRHRTIATSLLVMTAAAGVLLAVLVVYERSASAALREEQGRTRASLETSLDALHKILVRLGNEQLRDVPLAEGIAHGALLDAAALYREILMRHPGHERSVVQGGRALHALAMSFERRGESAEAVATLHEAIGLLGTDSPASAAVTDIRAHAWMSLASYLSDTPDAAATDSALASAERDFLQLAAVPRMGAESLRSRAHLRTIRSGLAELRSDPVATEALLREAVTLHRECLALGQPDPKDTPLLVTHLANLAKFLSRQQRFAESRTEFEAALAAARELPASAVWPPPEAVVAELQDGLGSLFSQQQDPAAEAYLRDSLAMRERVLEQFPNNVTFRMQLGGTLHNFGLYLYRQKGRTEEALVFFQRARERQAEVLAKKPDSNQALDFMGKHWLMIGSCEVRLQHAAAVLAAAEALAALPSRGPLPLLRAAELQLHAHRLQPPADDARLTAAMALLERAAQLGLLASSLDGKVFDVLRELPAFQALRQRLATAEAAATGAQGK